MVSIAKKLNNLNSLQFSLPKVTLYVHWPYCKSICHYCNFNRYLIPETNGKKLKVRADNLQSIMKECYHRELDSWIETYQRNQPLRSVEKSYEQINRELKISSIFIGGGTPSLMDPDTVGSVISKIFDLKLNDGDIEITLEANPTSVEAQKLHAFKQAGVNRLSLGVQSLNNDNLKLLGRTHTAEEAIECFQIAKSVFGKNVSLDLIYANGKDQNIDAWTAEVKEAINLGATHISAYTLTVEPGTALEKKVQTGKFSVMDSDSQADFYKATVNEMEKAHFNQYEISNFSIPGYECKHTMSYGDLSDYIAIGPGASSRVTLISDPIPERISGIQIKAPEKWVEAVQKNGYGASKNFDVLTPIQSTMELFLSSLRTKRGILERRAISFWPMAKSFFDIPIFNGKVFDSLVEEGLIKINEENGERYLVATRSGKLLLDSILVNLLCNDQIDL